MRRRSEKADGSIEGGDLSPNRNPEGLIVVQCSPWYSFLDDEDHNDRGGVTVQEQITERSKTWCFIKTTIQRHTRLVEEEFDGFPSVQRFACQRGF